MRDRSGTFLACLRGLRRPPRDLPGHESGALVELRVYLRRRSIPLHMACIRRLGRSPAYQAICAFHAGGSSRHEGHRDCSVSEPLYPQRHLRRVRVAVLLVQISGELAVRAGDRYSLIGRGRTGPLRLRRSGSLPCEGWWRRCSGCLSPAPRGSRERLGRLVVASHFGRAQRCSVRVAIPLADLQPRTGNRSGCR